MLTEVADGVAPHPERVISSRSEHLGVRSNGAASLVGTGTALDAGPRRGSPLERHRRRRAA